MRNIRTRIERLEAIYPPDVILHLRDGTQFHYPGPKLSFFMEGMKDIKSLTEGTEGTEDIPQNRLTPLLKATLETVSAEGCGGLWKVLAALTRRPVTKTGA